MKEGKYFRKFSESGRRELPWSVVIKWSYEKNLTSLDYQKSANANPSLDVNLCQVRVQLTMKIYFQAPH